MKGKVGPAASAGHAAKAWLYAGAARPRLNPVGAAVASDASAAALAYGPWLPVAPLGESLRVTGEAMPVRSPESRKVRIGYVPTPHLDRGLMMV
jgi:hypothetical protein